MQKVKYNLLVLFVAVGVLVPFLTIFNRTFASEYAGKIVGFGLGLILYPPTGLPLLVFSWFTRRWNVVSAAILAALLYIPLHVFTWRGLTYLGDDFDWIETIVGTIYGTTVGVAVLQLIFLLIGNILPGSRRNKP